MMDEKITYNTCMGSGCHEQCLLTTHVANGKIVRTERTVIPGTNQKLTGICQKGIVYAKFPYLEHPQRLHYPLKRVGERGEGKFERISWEQAMDEIGAKLNKIRDEMGPEAVLVNSFANSLPGAFTALHLALTYRFVHTFGATILPMPPVDMGIGWGSLFNFGVIFPYWGMDLEKLGSAKYILLWANAVAWTRGGYTIGHVMDAKEKGAKIVDIGALYDGSASISDEFIPIKPATDIFLALSMAHVIFRDGLLDTEFLTKHTVAPFLVRNDTGMFLRESEVVPGGNSQNYLVWNSSTAMPQGISPHNAIDEGTEVDLFAEQVVNGISCSTALVKLRDGVVEWSPEAQEKMTGIPAEVVNKITHEYVETEDSLLFIYGGMRYQNAGPAFRAVIMIPILAGKVGKGIGGLDIANAWNDYPVGLNPAIYFAGDPMEAKGKFPMALDDCLQAGFPYKALLNVMANPLAAWPNHQLWTETILPKLDLVVSYEVRMSETAKWADYVLPDTCTLERWEIAHSGNHMILCEPAIEPVYDAKPPADFWRELANRLGIGEAFDKTSEEWLDLMIQSPDPTIATLDPPLTIQRLKKEKMVRLNVPYEPINVWANTDFPTDSGRIEIYSEHLAMAGQAVPQYFEPVIYGPESKKYPLQLFVGRHRVFVMSMFSEFAELRQIAGKEPFIRMNPLDAAARGILNAEKVEVYNDRGNFLCKVRLSESVPPGMCTVFAAFPNWQGNPAQALMTPMGTPERQNSLSQPTKKYCQEHMGYPETLDFDHHLAGGWETLWDNLCEVRKV